MLLLPFKLIKFCGTWDKNDNCIFYYFIEMFLVKVWSICYANVSLTCGTACLADISSLYLNWDFLSSNSEIMNSSNCWIVPTICKYYCDLCAFCRSLQIYALLHKLSVPRIIMIWIFQVLQIVFKLPFGLIYVQMVVNVLLIALSVLSGLRIWSQWISSMGNTT